MKYAIRIPANENLERDIELHFGELFPRVGFIVTNSRAVVRF